MRDLQRELDEATQLICIISDLRRGYVNDITALRRAAELMKHPNWAGGASYTDQMAPAIYAQIYQRLSPHPEGDDVKHTVEEVVQFLEVRKPGVSAGIDWHQLLG